MGIKPLTETGTVGDKVSGSPVKPFNPEKLQKVPIFLISDGPESDQSTPSEEGIRRMVLFFDDDKCIYSVMAEAIKSNRIPGETRLPYDLCHTCQGYNIICGKYEVNPQKEEDGLKATG
ncbi:hypothetical protein GOV06_00605 [Candidatus Woesearchaeota archaeon]|nr:hypothetical protein [Candidatus Woesearchaeota archaeon]